jgi:hypothetical protein
MKEGENIKYMNGKQIYRNKDKNKMFSDLLRRNKENRETKWKCRIEFELSFYLSGHHNSRILVLYEMFGSTGKLTIRCKNVELKKETRKEDSKNLRTLASIWC